MASWFGVALTIAVTVVSVIPLGRHLWLVFSHQPQPRWDRLLKPVENGLLRWIGDGGELARNAWGYAGPLLLSNLVFEGVAFLLLVSQPAFLNPQGLPGMRWDTALHTAISFVTNTDQQHYLPEQSLGAGVQLGALQFLMYVSPATGLALGFAVLRGISGTTIGNLQAALQSRRLDAASKNRQKRNAEH